VYILVVQNKDTSEYPLPKLLVERMYNNINEMILTTNPYSLTLEDVHTYFCVNFDATITIVRASEVNSCHLKMLMDILKFMQKNSF